MKGEGGYRGADKSLARPGKKQATATEDFEFHVSYLYITTGGILVLYIVTGISGSSPGLYRRFRFEP
jgi:hypothetical protein